MKEFLKVAVLMALFFAALIAVLTWARNSNRQPSVILTSTECEPPCWYGIRPGESKAFMPAGAVPCGPNDVSGDASNT